MKLTKQCEDKLMNDLRAFHKDPSIQEIKYVDGKRIIIKKEQGK